MSCMKEAALILESFQRPEGAYPVMVHPSLVSALTQARESAATCGDHETAIELYAAAEALRPDVNAVPRAESPHGRGPRPTALLMALLYVVAVLTGIVAGMHTTMYGFPGEPEAQNAGVVFTINPQYGVTDTPAYCVGVEVRGEVGPFGYLPIVGGDRYACS